MKDTQLEPSIHPLPPPPPHLHHFAECTGQLLWRPGTPGLMPVLTVLLRFNQAWHRE